MTTVSTPNRDVTVLQHPTFGDFARQMGGVRSAEIELAAAHQREHGGRLGDILVQRGRLQSGLIREILQQQARWVARSMSAEFTGRRLPLPASLSVCLPCYNEQENIASTLDSACAILPEFVTQFEVICVNDGSKDNTSQVIADYARHDARVRLVQHDRNRGYGASVTSGLRAATCDLVMFTDSDGQFNLLDVVQLLAHLGDRELVIGYRHRRADKAIRLLNAWGWNRLVRLVLGVKVRDLDCAFKLFRRPLVQRLQLTSRGACINAEILVQCVRGGLAFAEVPVSHHPRFHGTPTGANFKVIAKAFRELPALWKYRQTATLSPVPLAPAADRRPA